MSNDQLHNTAGANLSVSDVSLSVAGVASAFVDGQSFTINGSGFGVKPIAAPIKFSRFNDMPDDSLLEANDPDWVHYSGAGATEGALIKSVNPRYAGSKAAYNDMSRNGFDTNYITFPATDTVFLSYWFATNDAVYGAGGTSWIGKLSRITSTPAAGGEGPYNGRGYHGLSSMSPDNGGWAYTGYNPRKQGVNNQNLDNLSLRSDNGWVRIDMWVKLSTPDQNDGAYHVNSWGIEAIEGVVANRISELSAGDGGYYQLDAVILGVMTANESGPTNAGMMVADPYIDSTRMRVELCDNADYSLSSAPEIQPATAWSDNSITITANRGRYSSGTYYLHVINDAGVSVGYQEVTI